jgi:hypothetical protein
MDRKPRWFNKTAYQGDLKKVSVARHPRGPTKSRQQTYIGARKRVPLDLHKVPHAHPIHSSFSCVRLLRSRMHPHDERNTSAIERRTDWLQSCQHPAVRRIQLFVGVVLRWNSLSLFRVRRCRSVHTRAACSICRAHLCVFRTTGGDHAVVRRATRLIAISATVTMPAAAR